MIRYIAAYDPEKKSMTSKSFYTQMVNQAPGLCGVSATGNADLGLLADEFHEQESHALGSSSYGRIMERTGEEEGGAIQATCRSVPSRQGRQVAMHQRGERDRIHSSGFAIGGSCRTRFCIASPKIGCAGSSCAGWTCGASRDRKW